MAATALNPIYLDRIEKGILYPVTEYEVVKDTPTTLVVDAHDGMGMVASHKAMKTIIEKAKKYGMAMAAIRNSSHYGIAGYWTSMAVNEGLNRHLRHKRAAFHRADVRR